MNAVRSEWTKQFSLRSTWWCLVAAVVLVLGYAAMAALTVRINGDDDLSAQGIAVGAVFYLGQFAVVSLATLAITTEYASGSIRSTLQWVPVRRRMLAAKGGVLAAVLAVLGVAVTLVAQGLSVPLMGGNGVPVSAGSVLTTSLAAGAYFALLGLLCLGLGTALRSTAGTITAVFLLLMMLPMLAGAMGMPELAHGFPGIGGMNAMIDAGAPNPLFGGVAPYPPPVGLLVAGGWAVLALAVGHTVLNRRDA
ncbi:ABC transporter permease [Amycolatopsis suaedae]|uniref:ABC transporter permease n=2 Tax=Amycolatopsis suaedae TaxID=2510978 RepID=A0A4Q7J6W7_9PSEU|nr:ABC transporter permease [Amycolatopsis suaedae]